MWVVWALTAEIKFKEFAPKLENYFDFSHCFASLVKSWINVSHPFPTCILYPVLIGLSIACQDAFSCTTSIHHLVQRIVDQKGKGRHRWVRISFERNEIFWTVLICSIFFLHEMLLIIFLAGNLKGSLVKIFAENDDRGNSVQIGPNFPAKSLSIYVRKIFLDTFSSFNWKLTCN